MRTYLRRFDASLWELPAPLSWRFDYTAGVPADSFTLRFPWGAGAAEALSGAVEFLALEEGETVFRGVVDEYELSVGAGGSLAELSGRGMAARLLDNEAEPADYETATEADILTRHVTPYGIETADHPPLPAVSGFSVSSGSSEWQVLYEFARYYGGVAPRFDRAGRLILSPWRDETALLVDEAAPLTALSYREKRYGVLSEVVVRDRARQAVERVVNEPFRAAGGRCRRVLSTPGRSNYLAMRYSGQFQLERSAARRFQVELTAPALFFAWPGDLVELRRGLPFDGVYRVLETAVSCDETGRHTLLRLGSRDAVL